MIHDIGRRPMTPFSALGGRFQTPAANPIDERRAAASSAAAAAARVEGLQAPSKHYLAVREGGTGETDRTGGIEIPGAGPLRLTDRAKSLNGTPASQVGPPIAFRETAQ